MFEHIRDRGVPLVFIDRSLEINGLSRVVVDDRKGAFIATEDAIKAGHTRIAHLMNPSISYIDQPTQEIGLRAVELIINNISRNDQSLSQLV